MKIPWNLFICASLCAVMGCAPSSKTSEPAASALPSAVLPASADAPAESPDDALRRSQADADLMLYESWPQETVLDNAHIANVVPVWIDAIDSAKETIDFEEYYTSNAPNTGLDRVIEAMRRAGERGVKIRFIIDAKMNKDENAEAAAEIAKIPNVEMRIIDFGALTGGVQHSKFFIVDGQTAYFGSQNFDWRALEQISEMGARLRPSNLVEPLRQIYELDWKLAASAATPIEPGTCYDASEIDYKGEKTSVRTVASPKGFLPCAEMWDLPQIIEMIKLAKSTVSVQLLNYATSNYDGTSFTELDDALTAAAARGVKVRLLVSQWSTRPHYIKDLKRLAGIENIEAAMLAVPEHSSGFVPYSRTIHSKFLVVDSDRTWLGTSNWSGDYFYGSRNVGIIASGKKLNEDLTESFNHYWNSEYAVRVDPNTDYPVFNQAKKE